MTIALLLSALALAWGWRSLRMPATAERSAASAAVASAASAPAQPAAVVPSGVPTAASAQSPRPAKPASTIDDVIRAARSTGDARVLGQALEAIEHCRVFGIVTVQAAAQASPAQKAALERITRFCRSDELAQMGAPELKSLRDKAAQLGDVRSALLADMELYRGQPTALAQRICTAFTRSASDPQALALIGNALTASLPTVLGQPADASVRRNFHLAVELARCELGADCGAGAWYPQMACATAGLCEDGGVAQYIARTVTPEELTQVEQFSRQLIERMRAGNCDLG